MPLRTDCLALIALAPFTVTLAGGCATDSVHERPTPRDGMEAPPDVAPDTEDGQGAARDEEEEDIPEGRELLLRLSEQEAPVPTRTFYWGYGTTISPGFALFPDDKLTIALDGENRLRYLKWLRFAPARSFGESAEDFPLSGAKQGVPAVGSSCTYDADVQTQSATDSSWSVRIGALSDGCNCDYVEALEGTRDEEGWSIVHTMQGVLFAASIDSRTDAKLYDHDPDAEIPVPGQPSSWSAPVELTAPDFYGPPVDHLKVSLDAQGVPLSFAFTRFARKQTFGTGSKDFPLTGESTRESGTITVDDAEAPTSEHFVLRYQVKGQLNDYVEGIDGTREGDRLVVRYFIKGKLRGATIDAHAAGTLVPSVEP